VYSTVGGIIKKMLVTEGDSVRVGTPLMRIFNKSTQLATANAQLTADYESLSTNMGKFDLIGALARSTYGLPKWSFFHLLNL